MVALTSQNIVYILYIFINYSVLKTISLQDIYTSLLVLKFDQSVRMFQAHLFHAYVGSLKLFLPCRSHFKLNSHMNTYDNFAISLSIHLIKKMCYVCQMDTNRNHTTKIQSGRSRILAFSFIWLHPNNKNALSTNLRVLAIIDSYLKLFTTNKKKIIHLRLDYQSVHI